MKKRKKPLAVYLAALLLLCMCVFPAAAKRNETDVDYIRLAREQFDPEDLLWEYAGDQILEITSDMFDESGLSITESGTYLLSGAYEGSVIVAAEDDDPVHLILDNAEITAGTGAAIYVKSAEKVTITLAEDSVNTLSNAFNFQDSDDTKVDGVIFSKTDLVINGPGLLNIHSQEGCGIVSKDSLYLTGGSCDITSAKSGIEANDNVCITESCVSIQSETHGIRAKGGDSSSGNIFILSGTFDLVCENNGLNASGNIAICGGAFTIQTALGAPDLSTLPNSAEAEANYSAKGILAGENIVIENADLNLDCKDDGIHSKGSIRINSGNILVSSGDDALHADDLLEINDGTLALKASEGLEAAWVHITGGNITIEASGDGLNAANKSELYEAFAQIEGGNLSISLTEGDNDGIDSNGDLLITGGTISISGAENPFDYLGTCTFSGGTILVDGVEINEITDSISQ